MLFQKRETLSRHGCVGAVLGPIAELRAIMRTDLFSMFLVCHEHSCLIGNFSYLYV